MKTKNKLILLLAIIISSVVVVIFIISSPDVDITQLKKKIKNKKELTVLIRNSPSVYYVGVDGPTGFEYDLVKAIADSLEMQLNLKILYNVHDILNAIDDGEADLAASAITITTKRKKQYLFTNPYQTVQQMVIYKRGHDYPKDIADLSNFQIVVSKNSSYDQRLKALKKEYPDLTWETTDELSTEQILQQVWEGIVECTIADNNLFAINRRYFPGLKSAIPISEDQSLGFVINKKNKLLLKYINLWLDDFEKQKQMAMLRDRYYGHINIFNYVDISSFHKRIDTRLSKYENLFKKAGQKNDIPWKLLAAQAYQESQWNPEAVSPTGVRGIMMLTKRTAESLGISNRLNPSASILGGAKYLKRLEKIVPENFIDEDKMFYSLAAYNVGMGHMQDAEDLAEKLGYNNNTWEGLKKALPLLSNKRYYKTLKYGYARGTEPVRYINRIQNYTEILEQKL